MKGVEGNRPTLYSVCSAFRCDTTEKSWCTCATKSCKYKGDKLQCKCGEEWKIHEWNWEKAPSNNIRLFNDNRDVVFHPVYSSGTAVARGQKLKPNLHHYWEIKILTNLYGTDIMIGIGTSNVVLSNWSLRFCSMLGHDRESWGYSYTGIIQHARRTFKYGPRYTVGSLIGVHVDMFAGTVEFYLNRRPLGVAFRGLKKHELYPMVCSTAAESAMRITCALSEVPSLQIECLKVISNDTKLLQMYWEVPGLSRIIESRYFWMAPKPVEEASRIIVKDELILTTDCTDGNVKQKSFCPGLFQFTDPRTDPDHFAYREVLYNKDKCHVEILKIGRRKAEAANADRDQDVN